MKINLSVRYEVAVLAIPRCLFHLARQTLNALPSLTTMLRELREAVGHLERLVTYAAAELPEIVYQLEKIREQLASIERRLNAAGAGNGHPEDASDVAEPVSPGARRSGSRRPS